MGRWLRIGWLAVVAWSVWNPAGWADDISDSIHEALRAYEAGDYSGAMDSLSFASAQLQQKQSTSLKEVFPKPLSGWQAEDSIGDYTPASFMGGGVSASRHYFTEASGKSVNIEIVTDSPMLQSVMLFMNNPMIMAAEPGTKAIKIKTYKGYQKWSSSNRTGEVNLVLQSRMLVRIQGDGIDNLNDVTAYANAINFSGLEEYLAK